MRREILILLCACLPATVLADEPAKAKTPLAGMPSKAGPHVEKIKALGDNEWLKLGAPAADPTYGKARGSSWGAKATAFAPDLGGAFLFGEGVHAFVKPDGHAMDDLWFYDLNAHRWVCLHPGTDTKAFTQRVKDKELLIGDDGTLHDAAGQPIPVHTLIHAWGYLAYDTDRKKFAFLGNTGLSEYFLGGVKDMREGLDLLTKQAGDKKPPAFGPWFYDVATGQFEHPRATGKTGGASGSFPQVHYLPSEKRFLVVGGDGVAGFDPARNEWTAAKPKGAAPTGYDRAGCYDSKRHRVYRTEGAAGLTAYDIKTATWTDLKPEGRAPASTGTHGAFYEYDADHDLVIAIDFTAKAPAVHAYDPKTNTWADPLPVPADGPKFQFAANTFYDRELNAFVCHVAGDSKDDGVIWVYRFKKRD